MEIHTFGMRLTTDFQLLRKLNESMRSISATVSPVHFPPKKGSNALENSNWELPCDDNLLSSLTGLQPGTRTPKSCVLRNVTVRVEMCLSLFSTWWAHVRFRDPVSRKCRLLVTICLSNWLVPSHGPVVRGCRTASCHHTFFFPELPSTIPDHS